MEEKPSYLDAVVVILEREMEWDEWDLKPKGPQLHKSLGLSEPQFLHA